MTARGLVAALTCAGCTPAVDGEELVFGADPPAEFVPYVELLHSGVRAWLTGRRWFGCDRATARPCGPYPTRGHGPLAYGALDPAVALPPNVGLLTVEGERLWDRVTPWAVIDLPDAFNSDPPAGRRPTAG